MKCLPGTPCRNDPSGAKPRKKPPALTIKSRGLCCVCPGRRSCLIQQFLRVFQHLLNGAVIRVDLAVGAFRQAQQFLSDHEGAVLYVVGEYGRRWFTQKKLPMADSFRYTAQNPSTYRAQQIARDLLDRFASGEIDRLCVIYTDSKGMSEVVRQTQLLPLRRQSFSVKSGEEQPEPTFEFVPTMEAVLDKLVRNYISGYIYSALVDSFCSEQSARLSLIHI